MLGGGVRQGGVLAAAGLIALDRRDELKRDHETARILADGLRSRGWDVADPVTNMVMARVGDLPGALTALTEKGVLAAPMAGACASSPTATRHPTTSRRCSSG